MCHTHNIHTDAHPGNSRTTLIQGGKSGKNFGGKRKKVLSTACLGLICGDIELVHGDIGLICRGPTLGTYSDRGF